MRTRKVSQNINLVATEKVVNTRPSHKLAIYTIMSIEFIKTTKMGHSLLLKPKPSRRRPVTESMKKTQKSHSMKWGCVTAQTNAQRPQSKAPGRTEASPSTHHKNKKKRKPHNKQLTSKDITLAKQFSKGMVNPKDLLSIYLTKAIRRDKPQKTSLHKHNGSWPKNLVLSIAHSNRLDNWWTRFKAFKNKAMNKRRYWLTCPRPWKKWSLN